MSRPLRPPRAVTVCEEIRLARSRVFSRHRPLWIEGNFVDYYQPAILGRIVVTKADRFATPAEAITAGRAVQARLAFDLDKTWKNWRTAKVRRETQDKDLHLEPVAKGGAR